MYHDTGLCVPSYELEGLLQAALKFVPDHGPATFMPEFPIDPPSPLKGVQPTNMGIRIIGIRPGGQIAGHRDGSPATVTFTRYHIPLQTNGHCWSFSDGVWQQLDVGVIYTMDPTEFHGAVNWGDTMRLHLLIDAL